MAFLKKTKLPIKRKYVYLTALLLNFIVLLQTSKSGIDGKFTVELKHVVFYLINYLLWAFLIDWIYDIVKRVDNFLKHSSLKLFLNLVLTIVVILTLHLFISNIFYSLFYYITQQTFSLQQFIVLLNEAIIPSVLSRLVDLIIIIIILKIIDAFQTVQKRNLQLAELENLLHVSELQSLKAQLQPHFLFNALHALHTLIGHDDTKAKSMVIKMSNLLRKMLEQRDKQVITFEEELNYLKDYLEIEEERFHDRLTVHFNIEDASKNIMVPVLILQPLAENAFKHGISLVEEKGTITISSRIENDDLIIEMSNTIPHDNQIVANQSTKFGLKNLEERLLQLYGDSYIFKTEKSEHSFNVYIAIKKTI